MTPAVTVASKPSGLPMAMAIWPRLSLREVAEPRRAAASRPRRPAAARDRCRDRRRARAPASSRPSSVVSTTLRAPCTTWLLVSARPSGRDDDAGAGAGARAVALDVDAHDARADAIDDVDDDARIGVERLVFAGEGTFGRGWDVASAATSLRLEGVWDMQGIWAGRGRVARAPQTPQLFPALRHRRQDLLRARRSEQRVDVGRSLWRQLGRSRSVPGRLVARTFAGKIVELGAD